MFRGHPPHTHTLPPQPSAEKPRTTSIHFPGTRPHQQALFPGQTGGRNLRTSRSRQVAFCGARAASAAWRRLGTRPSVRGRPRRAWRRRGLGGAADRKQGTGKAALWEGWWGGGPLRKWDKRLYFRRYARKGAWVTKSRATEVARPGSQGPFCLQTWSPLLLILKVPAIPRWSETTPTDGSGSGETGGPCACRVAVSMTVTLRAILTNTEQDNDTSRPAPPPPYKCKLVSVLGKKANKSLINVCCVVDDFVTTSVANGLCMRNNGLLAEREIA